MDLYYTVATPNSQDSANDITIEVTTSCSWNAPPPGSSRRTSQPADFDRSAIGARWFDDRLWAGAYATGPATVACDPHSASSLATRNGTTEQTGAIARVAGQIVSGNDYSIHLGGEAEWLIRAPHDEVTGAQTLTLNDRPELRIDPTSLISTGALAGVSGAQVFSGEAAATYGPL